LYCDGVIVYIEPLSSMTFFRFWAFLLCCVYVCTTNIRPHTHICGWITDAISCCHRY